MILNVFCVIGLLGFLASLKGVYDYTLTKVKAKEILSVVISILIFIGMIVAMGFAIVTLI